MLCFSERELKSTKITNMALIDNLISEGWLKTPRIIRAFKKIQRIDFLPEEEKGSADLNEALPIGHQQTISQPLVVAFMLEKLQPNPGHKILDIGSGSGWTAALLAEIVKEKGRVIALEVVPELKKFGEMNATKYGLPVEFICADASKGYEKEAPYDGILCSAAVRKSLPEPWKKQLTTGGRIVAPVGSSICLFVKKSENDFDEKEYPGFVFVPFVEK